MVLAKRISEFVVALDADRIAPETRCKLNACIVNGFGIALGGRDTPYYRTAAKAVAGVDGATGDVTLLYDGRKSTVTNASFVNSALFHGRAQEDTCGTVHVGAVVIPMLTALLETQRYPAERFLPALLAAYEVSGLFDLPYGRITAPVGFRATPLYGTLGAAAAAGYLMGLDANQMASALANAASFSGGILQSFVEGSDEWRYQVGVAARNGLTAATLAQAGSVSASEAFEGKAGFVAAFVRTSCDVDALASRLGRDWAIQRVTFKPYPVCAFNQTPVSAALAVRKEVEVEKILAVRVRMNPYETGYPGMDAKGPFNSISGTLMSIPFCIATTLVHGVPSMSHMTAYGDPAVAALIGRIDLITDEGIPNLSTLIEVDTPSGTVVQKKYMTTADYAYDRAGVSALVRRIGREQNISDNVYDRLEAFVDGLPGSSIQDVIALFRYEEGT